MNRSLFKPVSTTVMFPGKRSQRLLTLFICIFCFAAPAFAGKKIAPRDLYLQPFNKERIKEMPVMRRLRSKAVVSEDLAKIEYLIARVRQSSLEFIRNGDTHNGSRAGRHILWKYSREMDKVKTADVFIAEIASTSRTSGEIYRVRFEDGEEYPLGDILANELRYLEETLAGTTTPSPAS